MAFYAGVDLGKRKSQVKVLTSERGVVEELKIVNSPEGFRRIFRKYKGEIEVACEATSNAFWVADVLEPLVKKVHVGDTKKIRWIAEARIKTDKIDAGILAELLRADLFPTISIPPRRIRELRELVRGLVRVRRQASRLRNQVHGLLGRHGITSAGRGTTADEFRELLRQSGVASAVREAAESYLKVGEAARAEGRRLEREIRRELKGESELLKTVSLLETIPGVGFFSAALLVVEIWDVERFRDVEHLASYIGLVPSTYQTGQTCRNGPLTKQGNVLVRWILVEDAWVAIQQSVFFGKLYERHRSRKVASKAIVPVARALLASIYRVWKEGKSYEEIYGKKALVG